MKRTSDTTARFSQYLAFRYSKEGMLKANKKEKKEEWAIRLKLFLTESNDDSLKVYWEEMEMYIFCYV